MGRSAANDGCLCMVNLRPMRPPGTGFEPVCRPRRHFHRHDDGHDADRRRTMGTRTGDLDPGVLLHLMRTEHLDVDALETLVNHDSGLAGLSGGESQMQNLTARAQQGDADAALAVDAFTSAVRKTIGGYAALMGGIDLLVFTGGIGEHSAQVRDRVCGELGFLGLRTCEANGVRANVLTLHAEEEAQIALHYRALTG